MKRLREVLALLLFNAKTLVRFELLYKAASVLVFVPLLVGGFDGIMRMSGYSYLTLENVGAFLTDPLTLLALAVLLVLATVYAMVDISAVVFIQDQAMQRQHVTLGQVLRFAVKNALRVWRGKNVALVLVVLVLMPFLHIGLASGLVTTVSIPEFILDYIRNNPLLMLLFTAAVLGLMVLMLRWLYAFHYFTLEGCTFREARRKSEALGRGRHLRDLLVMVLVQAALSALYAVFLLVCVALAALAGRLFAGIFVLRWVTSTAVWLVVVLALAVMAALAIPVGYGCVGMLFYRRKAGRGELLCHPAAPKPGKPSRLGGAARVLRTAAGFAVVAGSLVLGFLLCTGRINPNIEYLRTVEVTAHRGASAYYPENTMAAFAGACELGADWIELDVQQSSDGQIFVIHDSNLKRTTGLDANTWELPYADIAALDAGSFFDPAFAGERIPLLSEVLAFAKQRGVRLNIELKPTGHETDFEQGVVDVIRAADFADRCVVTSLSYDVLERVKACDPGITTVYVMSLAYGDIDLLPAADHFSVEASNATRTLVNRVHNAGKELYVWTVNTREGMEKMIDLNVDNLITDDIPLARQCLYESRYSSLLEEYVGLFG